MIQAWELTLRSPRIWNRGQFHLAYSNQIAQAVVPFTGGLICPAPVNPILPSATTARILTGGPRPEKHAQRRLQRHSSLAVVRLHQCVLRLRLHQRHASDPYPGNYLPQHTTFDISLGKTFAEKYTVSFTALNVANRRVLLDNSLTFGGFHYNDPREMYVQFRWRFHY